VFQSNSLSSPQFFRSGGPHFAIQSKFSTSTMKLKTIPISLASAVLWILSCSLLVSQTSPSKLLASTVLLVEFHLAVFNYTMKPIIFTSKTLVVLKLEWLKVESGKLCFDLPSLKTLFLKHVDFEYQNHFIKLLSACPIF